MLPCATDLSSIRTAASAVTPARWRAKKSITSRSALTAPGSSMSKRAIYPDTRRHFAVLRCNHCDDAPCIEICPTVALFRRSDGIVDFDNERCIGCKSCMQACPYDALYIDPDRNTAAKCNFDASRVEMGYKPACEVVCPTQAILSGDLDDPQSEISKRIAMDKVSVRKPEKGTKPKLFYVGVDGDLLNPTMMEPQSTHLWADKQPGEDLYALSNGNAERSMPGGAREVYDVPHMTPWGKKIATYLWTKSISAGVLLLSALFLNMGFEQDAVVLNLISPVVSLLFLIATMLFFVFDLKKPGRFFFLLTKPNLNSWLVLGGYVLMIFGILGTLWLGQSLPKAACRTWLSGPPRFSPSPPRVIRLFFSLKRAGAISGRVRCSSGI